MQHKKGGSHFSRFSVWLENSNLSESVKIAFQYSFGLYVPISHVKHFSYILEKWLFFVLHKVCWRRQ